MDSRFYGAAENKMSFPGLNSQTKKKMSAYMECRQAFYGAAENKMFFPGLNAKTKVHLWSADRPFMVQQRIKSLFLALMLRQRCIYGVQTGLL